MAETPIIVNGIKSLAYDLGESYELHILKSKDLKDSDDPIQQARYRQKRVNIAGLEQKINGSFGDIVTKTTAKVKQKGAFMQSSTHQALVLGG